MSDYISRQAAIDVLHTKFRDGFDEDKWWNSTHVLAAIEAIPPTDVVPVVRCKDCENWQTDWNPIMPGRHYCAVMDLMMKADDFCSYGKRREE